MASGATVLSPWLVNPGDLPPARSATDQHGAMVPSIEVVQSKRAPRAIRDPSGRQGSAGHRRATHLITPVEEEPAYPLGGGLLAHRRENVMACGQTDWSLPSGTALA
jgi:hypothetical protein